MNHTVGVLLLGGCCVAGLALVPLGLPGLWLMLAAVVGYGWLTGFHAIGLVTIAVVLGLALLGELFELWLKTLESLGSLHGYGLARRYGGSPRAGWGALLGGLAGAVIGVPVPLVGSVIGAILGSFAGAMLFEYSSSRTAQTAVRAGWGALVGRLAAATAKVTVGIVMAVVALVAALRG